MARVVTDHGRVVISAWLPEGTMHDFNQAAGDAVGQALGTPQPPSTLAWHDPDALSALLGPYGFEIELEHHQLEFMAASPAAYLDEESREHPMAVAGLAVLEKFGRAEEVRRRLLAILEERNEDPTGFKATSRYVVATARRARSDPEVER